MAPKKSKRGIKPGQIPDWRPGAIFWKPLADGREITIYPLLSNKARLCVGPLADPTGYDVAYLYDTQSAAIDAGEMWDGENMERPPGYARIEFQEKQHMGTSPLHSQAVQPGTILELNETLKKHFEVRERKESLSPAEMNAGISYYEIAGLTEDGMQITIQATRMVGDPVGPEPNAPHVRVTSVDIQHTPGR